MNSRKINKVLIANRGEIAVRIIRTLRRLHIESVAVFADNDAEALHRRLADEAYPLGNGSLKDTYLNIQKIIDAALDAGVDAIHPGYGFLSENPDFAEACAANNLIFIGPDADTMRLMGNKIAARQVAIDNGIPVTFGLTGSLEDIMAKADTLPYPVLIKAAAGGGGKGMHIVRKKDDLKDELERASREAEKYFGDGTVFVEQYIENPRHIEVQILADHHGNIIHLHERECTIQRRYQKIIEESPSPTLTEEKRQQLLATAVKLCKGIGYKNAGTVEFIVDQDLNFYFLEVKGHAIEMRVYAEDPENGFLPTPGKVTAYHEPQVRGARVDSSIDGPCTISEAYDPMIAKLICHGKTRQAAIETAQHALKEFIIQGLTTNKAYLWEVIKNQDFVDNKIDTSFCASHQEALIKAFNDSRNNLNINDIAVSFLLYDFCKKRFEHQIENVWEDIGFWRFHSHFTVDVEGQKIPVHITHWEAESGKLKVESLTSDLSPLTSHFSAELIGHDGHQLKIMINGKNEVVYCSVNDEQKTIVNFRGLNFSCFRTDQLNDTLDYSCKENVNDKSTLISPMPGKVVKINVKEGDEVNAGTVMIVVEAMKMENNIVATANAKVKRILVTEGEMVDNKMQLIELEERS